MTCSTCAEFSAPRPIRLPADLTAAILSLQAAIADHRISALPTYSDTYTTPAFSTVPADGPWPEIVRNGFRCTRCGEKYLLSAETYHGGGGSLEAVTGG
jgi:hypothetical protein